MTSHRPNSFIISASDHGTMIVNRNDYRKQEDGVIGVGAQILETQSFDKREVEFVLRILRKRHEIYGSGVMALDCGANIGVHTIEWAKMMYGWGNVHAFEAQERLFMHSPATSRSIIVQMQEQPGLPLASRMGR